MIWNFRCVRMFPWDINCLESPVILRCSVMLSHTRIVITYNIRNRNRKENISRLWCHGLCYCGNPKKGPKINSLRSLKYFDTDLLSWNKMKFLKVCVTLRTYVSFIQTFLKTCWKNDSFSVLGQIVFNLMFSWFMCTYVIALHNFLYTFTLSEEITASFSSVYF